MGQIRFIYTVERVEQNTLLDAPCSAKNILSELLEFARTHKQFKRCLESDYALRQIFDFVLLGFDHFILANNLVLQFYHGCQSTPYTIRDTH